MKKKFLFSLIALMVLCSTALADYTANYEITVPDKKTDMSYQQGSYNVIGTLKVSKTAADSDNSFDPLKTVIITANYSDNFETGSTSTNVQYKLYTGDSKSEAKDLPSGSEIVFSGASIEAGTAEFNLACSIEGDTSSLSDGYYFSKLKFTHRITKPQVGDIVNFGKFNGSALPWIVLTVDERNNRMLLVTENCVTKQKFADSNYEWNNSSVRAYLNGTGNNQFFSDNNFDLDEKSRILNVSITQTTNQNKKSDQIIQSYGSDSVFLLSAADVSDSNGYFTDDSKRVCNLNNSACKWWLRSSSKYTANAGYVSSKGKVLTDGTKVSYTTLGVRPAIWIELIKGSSTNSAEIESEIGFTKGVTPSTEDLTDLTDENDGNSILAMNENEIKEKYEGKDNVTITGSLDSSEKLSETACTL